MISIIIECEQNIQLSQFRKMEDRINFYEKGYVAMKGLFNTGAYLTKSKIGQALIDLIDFRVSQMNGCAYCLDMHAKDLRATGESEQRLYLLSAWREAPFYTERERAALAWAEAVTRAEIPKSIQIPAGNFQKKK